MNSKEQQQFFNELTAAIREGLTSGKDDIKKAVLEGISGGLHTSIKEGVKQGAKEGLKDGVLESNEKLLDELPAKLKAHLGTAEGVGGGGGEAAAATGRSIADSLAKAGKDNMVVGLNFAGDSTIAKLLENMANSVRIQEEYLGQFRRNFIGPIAEFRSTILDTTAALFSFRRGLDDIKEIFRDTRAMSHTGMSSFERVFREIFSFGPDLRNTATLLREYAQDNKFIIGLTGKTTEELGRTLRDQRGNMDTLARMGFEETNKLLLDMYMYDVNAGIKSDIGSVQLRERAMAQFEYLRKISNNTGLTVEELKNRTKETDDTIAAAQARGLISQAEGDALRQTAAMMSLMGPNVVRLFNEEILRKGQGGAAVNAKPEDITTGALDLVRAAVARGGNLTPEQFEELVKTHMRPVRGLTAEYAPTDYIIERNRGLQMAETMQKAQEKTENISDSWITKIWNTFDAIMNDWGTSGKVVIDLLGGLVSGGIWALHTAAMLKHSKALMVSSGLGISGLVGRGKDKVVSLFGKSLWNTMEFSGKMAKFWPHILKGIGAVTSIAIAAYDLYQNFFPDVDKLVEEGYSTAAAWVGSFMKNAALTLLAGIVFFFGGWIPMIPVALVGLLDALTGGVISDFIGSTSALLADKWLTAFDEMIADIKRKWSSYIDMVRNNPVSRFFGLGTNDKPAVERNDNAKAVTPTPTINIKEIDENRKKEEEEKARDTKDRMKEAVQEANESMVSILKDIADNTLTTAKKEFPKGDTFFKTH